MNEFEEFKTEICFTFFQALDMALTGKSPKTVFRTSVNQRKKVEEVLFDSFVYYLSDGGYSRIYVMEHYDEATKNESVRLVLGDESRPEVKYVWNLPHTMAIRTELLNFLTAAYVDAQLREEEA